MADVSIADIIVFILKCLAALAILGVVGAVVVVSGTLMFSSGDGAMAACMTAVALCVIAYLMYPKEVGSFVGGYLGVSQEATTVPRKQPRNIGPTLVPCPDKPGWCGPGTT